MSTCRVMCHSDVGAPSLLSYKRDGLYQFLDVIMLEGYNNKYVNNIVRNGREVTLNYAEVHGYRVGQLLTIKESSIDNFNGNLYRVITVPTNTSLTIYLKDDDFDSYPEMSTETTMQSKVAPLNWEKVYESSTQRSFRSRRDDSSKIIATFKKPTFEPSSERLKTTNAICYEVDFSKDVDTETGSTVDSCFLGRKTQYGHSCQYWITATNSDDLASAGTWSNDTLRAPWTIIGDDKMVYVMTYPFTDGVYEQGYYRQFDPPSAWGQPYRYTKMYAFGDYDAIDPQEYLTGSSFYFRFYYFAAQGNQEAQLTSPQHNPFLQIGSTWSWYDYYYDNFDPTGSLAGARIAAGGTTAWDSYGYSCNYFLWNAYPERVAGGIVYTNYYAYNNSPSTAVNSPNCFLKGTFPYIRCGLTSLRNVGNAYDQHNRTYPTNEPTKLLYFFNTHYYYWYSNDNPYGGWLYELD